MAATAEMRGRKFCEAELHQQPAEALFFFASVGVVFGFRMPDGQRLVIKVHRPERSHSFLTQMGKVQQYLAAQGYPCPRPVAAPRPLASGIATIDELIDEGIPRDAHEPVVRHALAVALFQHIRLLNKVEQIGIDPFTLRIHTRSHRVSNRNIDQYYFCPLFLCPIFPLISALGLVDGWFQQSGRARPAHDQGAPKDLRTFRSKEEVSAFCTIRCYLSTMRKQVRPLLETLRAICTGSPFSIAWHLRSYLG